MSHHHGTGLEVKVDRRILSFDVTGADDGWPVFLLHGTPGSRTGPRPRPSVLHRLGVRLISYDRPGYGRSERRPERTVADAAEDVAAIADEMELDSFSVVGRSGGGPHALACAALLGNRVARAAVLVSLAPPQADADLDWFAGMTDDNVTEFDAATSDIETLRERLRLKAQGVADNPRSLLDLLARSMRGSDQVVVRDPGIRRHLIDSYAEALRSGPYGWLDDVSALRGPWGFDLSKIDAPVRLWHGADDNFAPASHTRWLAGQIRHAEAQIQTDTAHFGAIEVLPAILAWFAGWRDGPVVGRSPCHNQSPIEPGDAGAIVEAPTLPVEAASTAADLERMWIDNPSEVSALAKR